MSHCLKLYHFSLSSRLQSPLDQSLQRNQSEDCSGETQHFKLVFTESSLPPVPGKEDLMCQHPFTCLLLLRGVMLCYFSQSYPCSIFPAQSSKSYLGLYMFNYNMKNKQTQKFLTEPMKLTVKSICS